MLPTLAQGLFHIQGPQPSFVRHQIHSRSQLQALVLFRPAEPSPAQLQELDSHFSPPGSSHQPSTTLPNQPLHSSAEAPGWCEQGAFHNFPSPVLQDPAQAAGTSRQDSRLERRPAGLWAEEVAEPSGAGRPLGCLLWKTTQGGPNPRCCPM